MNDEPTLPTLPSPRWPRESPFGVGQKRSRAAHTDTHASSSNAPSSSDAVFSSDDDPALDNYVHGRRKKRYVGTWYDQQPASSDSADSAIGDETRPGRMPLSRPRRRQFKRQLDSGVWMALDEAPTDTDENDSLDLAPAMPRLALPVPKPPRSMLSPEEETALAVVRRCVDEGREMVDLSELGLKTLSNSVVESLSNLVPIPTVMKDVAFEHKDPSIKLFLSRNPLKQFPGAIANIEHLTVLTLRATRLTELPGSIASLKNLQSLNVASNSLRYLPGELLELMKKGSALNDLQFHPNPFFQPRDHSPSGHGRAEYEMTFDVDADPQPLGNSWNGLTTSLLSRTPVQFFNSARSSLSDFSLPPLDEHLTADSRKIEHEDFWDLAVPKTIAASQSHFQASRDGTQRQRPVGATSLHELALRAAARALQPHELEFIKQGEYPIRNPDVVERAVRIHRAGGQKCCVCKRETWNPLTEWLEFREVLRTHVSTSVEDGESRTIETLVRLGNNVDECYVPFVRKGCSWACIPLKAPAPSPEVVESGDMTDSELSSASQSS
ncbi:hypothetical protein B0T22DRAFT_45759 [Podospora appendiculata]|uniref:Leucine-rich repeat-containing protein n=1 Tax=Podospora appendiculata TaxID=314037 RepID=A0AAE0XHY5_9PEZI|nr:hypothetical protein B0T22DRAFT_45759 [Podospora appendiculata]